MTGGRPQRRWPPLKDDKCPPNDEAVKAISWAEGTASHEARPRAGCGGEGGPRHLAKNRVRRQKPSCEVDTRRGGQRERRRGVRSLRACEKSWISRDALPVNISRWRTRSMGKVTAAGLDVVVHRT